ncbi:MAG: SpoIIE family protein phosphatase [bacterium]|nr:SpoIIE family protein phosphatase [bacterium]
MKINLKDIRISLKLKITLVFLLLVMVMMITVGYIFTIRELNLRKEQVNLRIERLANNIATIRSVGTEEWDIYQAYIENQIIVNPDIVYIAIFDVSNQLKVHALNRNWLDLEFNNQSLTKNEQAVLVRRLDQRQIAQESQRDFETKSVNIIVGGQNLGTVNIGFSLVDLNDEMKRNLYRNLLLDVIFILLAIIISFVISSRIVNPLGKLTSAMKKISEGDFDQELHIKSRDEIGEMAATFNFMTKELQEKEIIENFSRELGFTIELDKISNLIAERIVIAMAASRAFLFLKKHEEASHYNLYFSYPEHTSQEIHLAKNLQICEAFLKSRKPLPAYDFERYFEFYAQLMSLPGITKNSLVCPFVIKEKVIGILILIRENSVVPFSENEINFLNVLIRQGSLAIENALLYEELTESERLKRELEVARTVQLSLLPQQNPEIEGLDICGTCIPTTEVGGDYFDYFKLSDKTFGIVIADVTGKGASAAFYMAVVKGIMLSLTSIYSSPKNLMSELNRKLFGTMDRRIFITMIYAIIDLKTKTLRFARAGHNALLVRSAKKLRTENFIPKGIGLGLAHDSLFDNHIAEQKIQFQPGDTFIFYTDGISEAMNEDMEEFGEKRLMEIVANLDRNSAQETNERIIGEINQFAQGAPQHDDITLVTIKIK